MEPHVDVHAPSTVEGVVSFNRSITFARTVKAPETTREASTQTSLNLGLSKYQFRKLLGRGGFGLTFLAFDTTLQREVVIKVPMGIPSSEKRDAIIAEACVVAQFNHRSIVAVYEVIDVTSPIPAEWSAVRLLPGQCALVMAYVKGTQLDHALAQRQFSKKETLAVVLAIVHALQEAHAHNAVHCDLKPANILLLEDGTPVVIDFGLAVMVGILLNKVAGTLLYMAPEQIRCETLDARTDLYAVGVMLYEMLTGRVPIMSGAGELMAHYLNRKLTEEVPQLSTLVNGIPIALNDLVMKAITRNPAARFQSAGELAVALEVAIKALHAQEILAQALQLNPQRDTEKYVALLKECLKQDPACTHARDLLCVWLHAQHMAAEATHNTSAAALAFSTLTEYDPGAFSAYREGTGHLTLNTTPPEIPVEVFIYQYQLQGKRMVPVLLYGGLPIGQTPLEDMPLPMGSYLVVLKTRHREIRYPVYIPRCHIWKGEVDLENVRKVHKGFVLVAGGPYWGASEERLEDPHKPWATVNSFAMQQYPVTNAEYCAFLNGLIQEGKPWKEVLAHLPKWDKLHPRWRTWRPLWGFRQGRVELPQGLNPDLPVVGITWHNATAYAAWFSCITGQHFTLPSYPQWVKATCGVDGRQFAWGDEAESRYGNASNAVLPGKAQLLSVKEVPPEDESVYGARFTVGIMHWLCEGVEGNPLMEVSAGGCFREDMKGCSPRRWRQAQKHLTHDGAGFRLVQIL